MTKVFLGGTCNNSKWRNELMPLLKIDYFNPVVIDWTPECQEEEIRQRKKCDYCLYVITPLMTGVLSIAELVDDSHKRPAQTLFCYMDIDYGYADEVKEFSPHQIKSLDAIAKMIESNGAKSFEFLADVAEYLNNQDK